MISIQSVKAIEINKKCANTTENCKNTGWNDKIVVLMKTTQQLYFKTFIEKINSGNLIM